MTDTQPTPAATQPSRTKLWCVVRIQDYRFTALDLAGEWTEPSERTLITNDRELAFQAGRTHGGLLMNIDGLPGVATWQRFRDAVGAARAAAAATYVAPMLKMPVDLTQAELEAFLKERKNLSARQNPNATPDFAPRDEQLPY